MGVLRLVLITLARYYYVKMFVYGPNLITKEYSKDNNCVRMMGLWMLITLFSKQF